MTTQFRRNCPCIIECVRKASIKESVALQGRKLISLSHRMAVSHLKDISEVLNLHVPLRPPKVSISKKVAGTIVRSTSHRLLEMVVPLNCAPLLINHR